MVPGGLCDIANSLCSKKNSPLPYHKRVKVRVDFQEPEAFLKGDADRTKQL